MEITTGDTMQVVYDQRHGYYKVAKEGYTLHYRNGFIPVIQKTFETKEELNEYVTELMMMGFEYYYLDKSAMKSFYVTDQSGNVIHPKQYKKYCKAGNVEYLPGKECKKPSWG